MEGECRSFSSFLKAVCHKRHLIFFMLDRKQDFHLEKHFLPSISKTLDIFRSRSIEELTLLEKCLSLLSTEDEALQLEVFMRKVGISVSNLICICKLHHIFRPLCLHAFRKLFLF